jgi:hypothetical protein
LKKPAATVAVGEIATEIGIPDNIVKNKDALN